MPEPFQNFTLVQDNATLHVACEVTNLLENEGVEVMDWPACSLDLNPINPKNNGLIQMQLLISASFFSKSGTIFHRHIYASFSITS